MGVFEVMPYTNLHQQNLDWLMKQVASYEDSIRTINEWRVEFTGRVEDVEETVTNLQTSFNNLYNAFDTFKNEVNTEFDRRSNLLNIQFQTLRYDLENDQADFKAQVNQQFSDLLAQLQAFKEYEHEYLQAALQQFLADLPDYTQILVMNPVRGYVTTVQEAIYDLYDSAVRYEALTATEYDSSGLSAAEYDALDLTALEYDQYGKRYIENKKSLMFMYHPYTGEVVPVKQVVNYIFDDYIRNNGITANDYDILAMSADSYDNKQLDANVYDFDASNQLP